MGRSVVRPRCQGAISESLLCASLRCLMTRWKLLWAGEETNERRGKLEKPEIVQYVNPPICGGIKSSVFSPCNQCPANNYTSRIHTDNLLSGTITCKSTIIKACFSFSWVRWRGEGWGYKTGFPWLATMTIKHPQMTNSNTERLMSSTSRRLHLRLHSPSVRTKQVETELWSHIQNLSRCSRSSRCCSPTVWILNIHG